MKTLLELITEEFEKAFEEKGYEKQLGRVVVSNRPDLCQYQCNGAMAGAKKYHKAPIMIANDVVEALQNNDKFEMIEAVMPGFINMNLSSTFVADYLNELKNAEKYGVEAQDKTVVIDYGGANAAKPLHVGHLRSAVIGESVKRIKKYVGNNVIGDAHLGDWGLQMGLIIMELKERQPDLVYFDESYTGEYPEEPPFTLDELSEIYPTASAKSKEDAAFKEAAQQATVMIQKEYPPYLALWKHIMAVSLPDLKKNYGDLDVTFDLWKGESDAKPYIPKLMDVLEAKDLVHESQGAMVVDVAEEGDKKELPPCIVKKSDGAALYATSDLGTIIQREEDFHPDEYIYVADKRQELHFTQVFRVAKKAEIVKPETKLEYMGFGTVNGKDGKPFKTRDGGVMRLGMLISQINDAVYQKMMENRSMDEADAKEISKIVGLAALKYGDLSNQATKDYIFDTDRFASFEGNTGPYILYTIVRIKSILEKYRAEGNSVDGLAIVSTDNTEQMNLMLEVAKVKEVLENAAEELAPHKICAYVYDLSNVFNSFYHSTKILAETDAEKQKGYIALIKLTKEILETCIDLLGFKAPERM
ncbi:MAG: arginine--tRNA ligase [Eubacterium sp.]|nr:arginine--tRNA ligase [Eubacterium sp.]